MQVKGGAILGSTTTTKMHVYRALPRGRWVQVYVRNNTWGGQFTPDKDAFARIKACATRLLGHGELYKVVTTRPDMPRITATDFVALFGRTID